MAARVVMPSFGMYTVEGKVAGWLAEPGSLVEAGQPIVDVTTEKANYELESPAAGRFHPVAAIDAVLPLEGLIALVLEPGESVEDALAAAHAESLVTGAPAPPPASAAPRSEEAPGRERARVSPLARRLASELGVDPATVTGSGPGGRIVEADVRAAAAARLSGSGAEPARGVRDRMPLAGDRRTIGERLRRSQSTAVALTLTREVAAGALVAARRALAARIGAPLPWDALFVRLLGEALAERGEWNAFIEGDEIVRLAAVDVGFAVSLDGSLVAPVVRDADRRPLAELARDVRELAARARAGRLFAADLAGGSSTVTNLGALGVDAFTPVLNPPQATILGIGRIVDRAAVVNGTLAVAPTCVLSLTFDHRVADGAPAAELLAAVARRMGDAAHLDRLA